ncbi:MAG: Type I restriction-modification system, specificity subunit S (EC [uncultured Sulfurovum sp.]|uniref:Type I restriction-modification system, specificity subunit S (EC) n=1 Tax=uncultured Sulfurovum sp. TaxID=269237 RepID=A0A6S6TF96_9BACT|nr:MAG: Type I restriction-modification system, specificity subunit S (EC [uncultured Sulfurovum sp.]
MMFEWNSLSLRDCITHKKGYAFKSKDYQEDGTPIVKVTNLTDNSIDMSSVVFVNEDIAKSNKSVSLKQNDIIIATVGSWATNPASVVGKTVKVPSGAQNALLNQNAVIIRPIDEKIDKIFLYYLLKNQSFGKYLVSNAQGSANQASITLNDIYSYQTTIPSLLIQKKIAHILSTLDDKIELNRKMNQTLEEMAQALFKSWFVDFDPVHVKVNAAGREDALGYKVGCTSDAELEQAATALGVSKEVLELFPNSFVESEMGMIPEGWEGGSLSDIAVFENERISQEELTQKNYISTENMLENKKGIRDASSLPNSVSVPSFEPRQTLVSNIRPYFKKIWLANISGGRSADVLGFKSKDDNTNEFLFNVLYQDQFFAYMMLTSIGAKMPRGDKKAIMQFSMALPSVKLMQFFSMKVKSFYTLVANNHQEIKTLQKTRDTLLPKLLSGELDVSEVDI